MENLMKSIDKAFEGVQGIDLRKYQAKVGDLVEFDYKGEHRGGTVEKMGRTTMTLKTAGGYRQFSYVGIENFVNFPAWQFSV